MAILLDGEMLEAGQEVEERLPEGEEEVVEKNAEPDEISKIICHYLTAASDYAENDPYLKKYNFAFDASHLHHFARYICFDNHMQARIRRITKEEYIGLVRKNSPQLAELIQDTDLMESLPVLLDLKENEETNANYVPKAVRLLDKKSFDELTVLYRFSNEVKLFPDYGFFSLFMEHGKEFRAFLKITKPEYETPLLLIRRAPTSAPNKDIKENHLLEADVLFTPERLLRYTERSGNKNIGGMIEDYETVHNCLRYSYFNSVGNVFEHLEKANPELTIENGDTD